MAGTINISKIGQIDEIPNKPIYFLASIIDNNIWTTKNIKYNTLSNNMVDVISTAVESKFPGIVNINNATNNISYLGSLSSNWENAYGFRRAWSNKLDNIFEGYQEENAVTSYINNSINTTLDNVSSSIDLSVYQLSSKASQISSIVNECITILNSIDKETLRLLEDFAQYVSTIQTNTNSIATISTDLYKDDQGGDIEDIEGGGKYSIVETLNDIDEFVEFSAYTASGSQFHDCKTLTQVINRCIDIRMADFTQTVNKLQLSANQFNDNINKLQLSASQFNNNINTLSTFIYGSQTAIGNRKLDAYIRYVANTN